jgi:undecaprenyl-diphosphatase
MLWIEIILLAIVQGIGEFLPISSSGHVVVGSALFEQFGHDLPDRLTVNIALHLGTLLSILVVYWRRIARLLGEDRRVIGLLVVASVPAAIVGLTVEKSPLGAGLEAVLNSPLTAGLMFPVTGLMLLWSARREPGDLACRNLTVRAALWIGLAQAFAILPGISRSGTTIVAGLACGLDRKEAATFSFLMAIPVIGGGGLLKCIELFREPAQGTPPDVLLVGALVSFAVGTAALWWLIRWLDRGKLHWFAWWVIPLGIAVVAWQVLLTVPR